MGVPDVISNIIFRDGAALGANALSASDPASAFAALTGHFALHLEHEGEELLARDALGVNKLFYAVRPDGIESSSYFIDLVRRGHAPQDIWSVPAGHLARVWPARRRLRLEKFSPIHFADDVPAIESELPAHAARIGQRLHEVFESLRFVLAQRPLYVTLSGGLDSTTVAALTREHIGGFTAVTLVIRDGSSPEAPSSDLFFARKVAAELGVPLEVIELAPRELPELLDEVLIYGQDFRDFNVHCGLVNAALAKAIARLPRPAGAGRPCVLTGDTMNELMADYTPVEYGERLYYTLPELSPGKLRKFLVAGLDSGDREVGIFGHWGIDTIQPDALAADAYASLPCGFLDSAGAKQKLARLIMGERVPGFIYDRPKVRAQVADSQQTGGTMGALIDHGIDQTQLARRFCELFGFAERDLKSWIRAGVYRFTNTYPGERQ